MEKSKQTSYRRFFSKCLASWAITFFLASLSFSLQGKNQDHSKKKYDPIIGTIAQKHGVDTRLVHSIISAESDYSSTAVSSRGAVGLMQLMPETAREYGVKNLFDPEENIEGGIKYLKDLIKLYNGKRDLVLAAYNAGQEAIKKFGGIPPYPETKNYIRKVKASYNKPFIGKTQIYKFYDSSGKLVLTNDPHFYLLHKEK